MKSSTIVLLGALLAGCGSTRPGLSVNPAPEAVAASVPSMDSGTKARAKPVAHTGSQSDLDTLLDEIGASGIGARESNRSWVYAAAEGEDKPAGGTMNSTADIARELANPNTPLASLTFRNQFFLYKGDLPEADDQWSYNMLFQPVFPFELGTNSRGAKQLLFVRPAIPFVANRPTFTGSGFDGETGLGDIGFDIGYGVTEKSGFIWGVGMTGLLPTASSSDLGAGRLALGPEALLAKLANWGVAGILVYQLWDVAGWSDTQINTTFVNPIFTWLLHDGWSVSSAPIVSYDWVSEEWTAPLQVKVGKTHIYGKTPIKIEFELNWYFEQPDAIGPEWMLAINITPVVKNVVAAWFNKGKK
jgi:hypothetical protein